MMRVAEDFAFAWQEYGLERGSTLAAFLPSCRGFALGVWVATIIELACVPLSAKKLTVNSPGERDYPLKLFETSLVLVPRIGDAYKFDDLYPDLAKKIVSWSIQPRKFRESILMYSGIVREGPGHIVVGHVLA